MNKLHGVLVSSPHLRIAVCLLVVATAWPSTAMGQGEPWPFGKAGRFQRGRDLWNLGLLGAKGWDADRALPEATGGRRSSRSTGAPAGDEGPTRLRIIVLFPGGPADKAGLRPGDVIVGVGKKRFKDGFLHPLAKALKKAESGAGKGMLSLLVEREGHKKALRIKVAVPVMGRMALKPTRDPAREEIVDAALAWLQQRQRKDGGYEETLSGRGGAVIQACLAGLCYLANEKDPRQGPLAPAIRKAAAFVRENVFATDRFASERKPGEPSWDQSNWPLAHAAIFLGELHGRTGDPDLVKTLQRIADQLSKNQVQSGGWAHGTGGKNALGYLELNIVTGLALCGLGMARQAGCDVSERVILAARRYIKESSSGGGVGYSANPGQKGQGNIGRSAAVWLGYRLLGLSRKPDTLRIKSYVERNAGNVMGGHASLMQHILLAGLAAHALGSSAVKKYWQAVESDLVLARAPDGSFQPRPWHETLGLGSNTDVSFGEVWTTTAWTLVLSAAPGKSGRPGLPLFLHLKRTLPALR